MKLFEFFRRQPEPPPSVIVPPPPPKPEMETPEAIIDGDWRFPCRRRDDDRQYDFSDIRALTSISIARSLDSIADDLTALREHFVPVTVNEPPPAAPAEPVADVE